jgi:hypothetical protein
MRNSKIASCYSLQCLLNAHCSLHYRSSPVDAGVQKLSASAIAPGATKAQQNTVLQHTALGEAGACTPKYTCGLPALGHPWDPLSTTVNINLAA